VANECPLVPKQAIVWGVVTNTGQTLSHLLEWNGSGARIVGTSPGAIILAGTGVYRWESTVASFPGARGCQGEPVSARNLDGDERIRLAFHGGQARRMDIAEVVHVVAYEGEYEPFGQVVLCGYSDATTLLASMGPFLFVEVKADARYVGNSLPESTENVTTYNLETRERVTQADDRWQAEAFQADPWGARNCLVAAGYSPTAPDTDTSGFEGLPVGTLAVMAHISTDIGVLGGAGIFPLWSKTSGLRFVHKYFFWRDSAMRPTYCQSHTTAVPSMLREYVPATWIDGQLDQLEGLEIRGLSTVFSKSAMEKTVAKLFTKH
jgi:hypothetical protein